MLYLIGAGIASGDIPFRALEILKRSEVFVENYTAFMSGPYLAKLSELAGKDLKSLERRDLEEDAKRIVRAAKDGDVAVLTGGDPLVATTHKILYIEARKQGVDVEVVHSSSIISAAIGESGLDFYRFGQITTIPEWSEHYRPVSFYEVIERNTRNGLHSLVLLDYSEASRSSMKVAQALNELEEAEKHYRKGVINSDSSIIVMVNLSHENEQRLFGALGRIKNRGFERGPAVIIIPSKMSDVEKEVIGSAYQTDMEGKQQQ